MIRIFRPLWSRLYSPNIIRSPSGDQFASIWLLFSLSISCASPPLADTSDSFQEAPGFVLANAICLPSGDQWGRAARSESVVSCRRSEPSARARHNVPSGIATYVIHLLSLENSTSVADNPEIKGTNCFFFA